MFDHDRSAYLPTKSDQDGGIWLFLSTTYFGGSLAYTWDDVSSTTNFTKGIFTIISKIKKDLEIFGDLFCLIFSVILIPIEVGEFDLPVIVNIKASN